MKEFKGGKGVMVEAEICLRGRDDLKPNGDVYWLWYQYLSNIYKFWLRRLEGKGCRNENAII